MTRSLSARELALIESWEADRRRALTLDDIQRDMGADTTRNAAAVMAGRLREKGFLTQLGRGLYGLVPVAHMGAAAGDIAAYLDGLRLQGIRFYLGFDTVAGHYGWYPEAYGRVTLGIQALTRRALRMLDESTSIRTFQVAPSVFEDGVTYRHGTGCVYRSRRPSRRSWTLCATRSWSMATVVCCASCSELGRQPISIVSPN